MGCMRMSGGPRLSIIPARAATDKALKPRDLQVLCVLGRHTDELGWCTRSQVKMSVEMGCARSTVFEAIERLVSAGYLERHVVEQSNGRDAPHIYRVILDPVHPSLSDLRPEPDDDSDGSDPADQSAPPAGISAPPAGSGPAPKNDPLRTNLRESAREEEEKVRRWLKKTHPAWPTYVNDSDVKAFVAAMKLTDDERDTAASRLANYVETAKASGKAAGRTTICSFAVYLDEKRWEKLPAKSVPVTAADDYAPPFGPVWMAWVVGHMLDGPTNPNASAFAERWPQLFKLFDMARHGKGYRFGERWHALKGQMIAVLVDAPQWNDWKACFHQRGWPWLPDPGRVAYFPVGGPDGLETFEQALRGNHDAGGREAAE
ncbi:MAG: helix-turn-helix domain-containing protein [Mesorhizobium sp.]|nr:MAG: helix-turn-helix domain-containing protein [Mesorhizobium sp.]